MSNDLCRNRRARFDYHILETFEAGIALFGTEIKSLRAGGGSITEAYIDIKQGEAWLIGASIAPYSRGGTAYNHEERRPRKLLLHKRELDTLRRGREQKGLTIVPLSLFLTKRGIAKLSVGLARGKKTIDKRETIKARDESRSLAREMKRDA